MMNYRLLISALAIISVSNAWTSPSNLCRQSMIRSPTFPYSSTTSLNVIKEPDTGNKASSAVDQTTEKYGLEVGLVEAVQKDDNGKSAKDLLAKYGVAYLATSIPLAIVSFSICYALVDSGVDVAGLLGNVGIEVGDTGEKVGTFAIAYTAHKAASPIRFPPTVLLTPLVAKLIGKEPVVESSEE